MPAMVHAVRWLAMAWFPAMALQAAPQHPNVLLILTDGQGYGDLSSSGNPQLHTPNLDRLRAASTDFSHCIAAPGGTATRAEILSGKHEFRCGVSHRCLLYTSPSPRDGLLSRMPSSA